MIFYTIVLFALYSITYFVVSQRKIRRMRKNIALLKKRVQMTRMRTNSNVLQEA